VTLDDRIAELVEMSVRAATAPLAEKIAQLAALVERDAAEFQPLHKIRGGSTKSASEFLRRHPELKQIGVRVGRSILFRPHEVEQLCREIECERHGLRVVVSGE
jgi:hypothetical protein